MYRNVAGSRFADVTFADFDHDGDQDIFEQMGGAYPGDAFGNALYENPGFDHNWIKIELRGVSSNRRGVGARIRIVVREGDAERTIYKTVNSGATFGGNPMRQEIGLGSATRIEQLEVYWPVTGETQLFTDLAVNELLRIEEGQTTVTRIALRPLRSVGH